jgi:hypothetical protein
MHFLDSISHPWPNKDKTKPGLSFRFRKAVWMSVRPFYGPVGSFGVKDITRMFILRMKFPFFSYNIKWCGKGIHGYIGWKPIPVANDPQFCWRDLNAAQDALQEGELFVQLSARGGINEIS